MLHRSLLFRKDRNLQPLPIQTGRSEEYEIEYIHSNRAYYQKHHTWEPLSNLVNAQEAVQLYLNKKNRKGGLLGEEGDGVRIYNSSSLETRAQELDLNPDPGFPQAACPRFPKAKPPQADTKNVGLNGKAIQTEEISAPNGGLIKEPNGGNKFLTISFISLKSTLATNQEPSP
ncbi:hypothetical protein DSO57_1028296 [Entomophthora muscae]|uniref:Uncharacterized protein n=1 Tax=Entomophthora muscae TaxID=34485 RepID=A0ACC2SEF6_9FUNG|nr:hypothetical protein DSO57_1028296 [Entomophthora muscae]